MFILNELPFGASALEPYISEKTIQFHYGKHHQAYLDNLNKLVAGTELENLSLLEVISSSANNPERLGIFNNAAQVYNHDFFWQSLRTNAEQGIISENLSSLINNSFGSFDNFREEFKNLALSQFGSGWVWLVRDGEKLVFLKTANADTAFLHQVKPLLVIDVWEHAYYLDYQNRRADFVLAIIDNLLNWQFASNNLNN